MRHLRLLFRVYTQIRHRSLTARQREILQQYADDVEGRSTTLRDTAAQDKFDAGSTASRSKNVEGGSADNGRDSFTFPAASSEDGWLSRAWKRIRGLTGL